MVDESHSLMPVDAARPPDLYEQRYMAAEGNVLYRHKHSAPWQLHAIFAAALVAVFGSALAIGGLPGGVGCVGVSVAVGGVGCVGVSVAVGGVGCVGVSVAVGGVGTVGVSVGVAGVGGVTEAGGVDSSPPQAELSTCRSTVLSTPAGESR